MLGRRSVWTLDRIQVFLGEWCLISILMFYPFVATFSILSGLPNTPIAIVYRAGYLTISLALIFISIVNSKKDIVIAGHSFFLFFFWLIYLVRMYYDFFIVEISAGYASKGFLFFFQYGFLGSFIPALMITFLSSKMNYARLYKHVRFICLPLALCLLYIIDYDIGLDSNIFLNRASIGEEKQIIGPIILSQYGALIAIVGLFGLVSFGISLFDLSLIILGLLVMIIGASRGPAIAFVAVLLVLVLIRIKQRIKNLKVWGYVVVSLLLLILFVVKVIVPKIEEIALLNRIQSSVERGQGLNAREETWNAAWNQFLSSPIYGDRIVENYFNFYPHNLILEVLMATGLIGGLAFFIMLFKSFRVFWRSTYTIHLVFFLLFLLYFIFTMFSGSIVSIPQFWCLLALTFSIKINDSSNGYA